MAKAAVVSLLALLYATASVNANPLLARAACNADNCARAVTGTAGGQQASHLADCSSFFKVTVTPATSTATATVTPPPVVFTSTITTNPVYQVSTVVTTVREVTRLSSISSSGGAAAKRAEQAATSPPGGGGGGGGAVTVSPTAVPGYAGSCSGSVRYSSACSYAGVSRSTSTAATPVTTVTVTAVPATTEVFVAATTTIKTTVTAVQTVLATALPCGSTVTPGGGCGCHYTVTCGRRGTGGRPIETLSENNEIDCARACDNLDLCLFANYNVTSGACTLQNGSPTDPGFATEPADDTLLLTGQCDQPNGSGCPNK